MSVRRRAPSPPGLAALSQRAEQLGVGQAAANSAQTVLGFEEFCECVARCGVAKYLAVKQMDNGAKISAFVKNLLGEANEEDCMREVTTIRSVRYDASKSKPLQGESPEQHQAFLAVWAKVRLDGLYAFPLWEKDVLSLMHMSFKELSSIFRAYSKSLGETSAPDKAGSASTMSLDEFHDFVVDVGLETDNGVAYTFENMKALFVETNKSGKGLAGPAADSELELPEFLGLLVRCAFWRLNPEYGELTMEHQDTLLPVPQCLEQTLRECVLPKAHRDDAAELVPCGSVWIEEPRRRPRPSVVFRVVEKDVRGTLVVVVFGRAQDDDIAAGCGRRGSHVSDAPVP